MNKFYITTPIYYPNAEPHLGHVYTTLCADTVARYHRLTGDDTFFLTGTDEHGIKMVKTAAEQGIEPQALADRVVKIFEDVWKELDVTNDDFIRTTSARTSRRCRKSSRNCVANGDIYLGSYEGWYDEGQEEFVTETEAKANEYKSAVTGKPLSRYKEPTYFFRLKKYVPAVLEYIEQNRRFHPAGVAAERSAEQAQGGRGGSVDQPGDAEVGHPAAATIRRTCFTSGSTR